jgi:hypothetical protein|tara:strand:+ start:188 stop:406 length:219 start_codon:yes stop_codon:yes gene_type:complete
MIKYLLGAILALAVIGGAFRFESDDQSWQLIILKKEALNSVTNGGIRIYKIVTELISDSELVDSASVIMEDS